MAAKVSVVFPGQPDGGGSLAPFADLVARGQAARLWVGESVTAEVHACLAALAGSGSRIPVGTAVALTPLRHPYAAALQARSLAALHGAPVVAAYGVGPPDFAAALLGEPYERPLHVARDYAATVRALIRGPDRVPMSETFPCSAGLGPLEHPPVEVGLGVLRPRMARAAGAVADVGVTWLTPPGYLERDLIPELVAAASAGRARTRVVAVVPVALHRPGRDPRRQAIAATGNHLGRSHYADMLRRAGVALDVGDPGRTADALLEAGVVLHGSAEAIARGIAAYHAAGADEVVINTLASVPQGGIDAALRDAEEVLAAASSPAGRHASH